MSENGIEVRVKEDGRSVRRRMIRIDLLTDVYTAGSALNQIGPIADILAARRHDAERDSLSLIIVADVDKAASGHQPVEYLDIVGRILLLIERSTRGEQALSYKQNLVLDDAACANELHPDRVCMVEVSALGHSPARVLDFPNAVQSPVVIFKPTGRSRLLIGDDAVNHI